MTFARTALALALAAALPLSVHAQQGDGSRTRHVSNVDKPAKVPATPERLAGLKVPAGFRIAPFATGLGNVRVLAVAPDGSVYASRRDEGDVILLKDADGDGRADGQPLIVAARAGAHGLAIRDGKLYLVTVKELFVADIRADGTLGTPTLLVGDLGDSGQHPNRTIAFGPDGLLYLSVGSTCNACNESNPEHATVLRFSADFKSRTIVASGLRNTIGFAWHPTTGELWGFDHGIDHLGDDVQPEELNRIEPGKQYGWPHVWGDGRAEPPDGVGRTGGFTPQSTPPGAIPKGTWRAMSQPMVLGHTAHAAPMQMAFYSNGSFPAAFDGDAFVAMRGSWNRSPASGHEVVRVRFANGQPQRIEPFVTGFLTDGGRSHIARPVGLAVARDGALLIGDDANGSIYRVVYEGRDRRVAGTPAVPPAGPMQAGAARGFGVPLAAARPETALKAEPGPALGLASPSFAEGGPLDKRFSAYFDDVSPALEWQAVPGARSYAIVVEDPDSTPLAPFVHWVAWNVPATTTRLVEGLPKQPRLTAPDGVLQGANSRGSVGWFGPRPPVGDPPHRYHVQVLALDGMLDVLPGSDRDAVLAAARGKVIGKATVVGTYRQTEPPLK
jgi:Raf kinase inhibitor-like YbhB/YbcL family protein